MKLDPRNRYVLLVDVPKKEEKETSNILLPEEYTIKSSPYGIYQIQQCSADCTKLSIDDVGKLAVVNDLMVETVSSDRGEFLLVLEQHIYGILD
jgi:hypothetical protein